ncbi:MAG: bifunctional diguanylate cyclase/phosphodiesterase [Gammaproteobacteria bacterium]|nr:bifunctional diguanylate cyclase/phosphodiesterase [Gammaproteobacteria bacterium]
MNFSSRAHYFIIPLLIAAAFMIAGGVYHFTAQHRLLQLEKELQFYSLQFHLGLQKQVSNSEAFATLVAARSFTRSADQEELLKTFQSLNLNPSIKGIALVTGNQIQIRTGEVNQQAVLAFYRAIEQGKTSLVSFEYNANSEPFITRAYRLNDNLEQPQWLFVKLPFNAYRELQQHLNQYFAQDATTEVSFTSDAVVQIRPDFKGKSTLIELEDGAYQFDYQQANYQLLIKVPKSLMDNLMPLSYIQMSAILLLMFLFAAFIVTALLHLRYLQPVRSLLSVIQNTQFGEAVKLKKRRSKHVVDQLVNTYIDMLRKLNRLAAYDHLTGLSNRTHFQYLLQRQLRNSARHGRKMALLYIDLDNFKKVNDHYGHSVGDQLLKAFSERLLKSTRPSDLVANLTKGELARLAGDEFALLLTNVESTMVAEKVGERILSLFEGGFLLDGINHNVQASIGIVVTPDDGNDVATLLQNADAAMYQAKLKGKNRLQFYNKEIAGGIQRKQFIERVLSKAIEHAHFHLVYMPIYEAKEKTIVGVEVLIRAPTLTAKGIGPEEFIPVAESTGLIKAIDTWVLNESMSRLNYVSDRYGFDGFFAINISAVELHNKEFPGMVRSMLMKHQVQPERIELEITETSFVDNIEGSIRQLNHLKSLGVSLSLDDFGTGYTAFTQLIEFPVDKVKIDRSFIKDLDATATDKRRMVDIVLALADLYQLEVIAEGVENDYQIDYLRDRGCEMLQGFYLSKPLSWDDFQALVERNLAAS